MVRLRSPQPTNTSPTIETLQKIAKALNIGADDLIK